MTEVEIGNLKRGTRSCGCLHRERVRKHGKRHTRLYSIWLNMHDRCCNINNKCYSDYGGRGITICDEWLNDFMSFHNWAMNNGYQENLTIDRIDVNGNYEPNNCRWADMKTQNRNKRNNKNYTINGETHCLKEWCEILNLNYGKVKDRLNKSNWSIDEALELKEGSN